MIITIFIQIEGKKNQCNPKKERTMKANNELIKVIIREIISKLK